MYHIATWTHRENAAQKQSKRRVNRFKSHSSRHIDGEAGILGTP